MSRTLGTLGMPWLTYKWLHRGTYLDKIRLKYLSEIAASCRLSFPPKIRQIAVCSQQSLQAARCVQFRLGYIIDNSEKSLFNHQIQRTHPVFQHRATLYAGRTWCSSNHHTRCHCLKAANAVKDTRPPLRYVTAMRCRYSIKPIVSPRRCPSSWWLF